MTAPLTPPQGHLVEALVAAGRYADEADVLRASLRLLEAEDAERLAFLRRAEAAVTDALASVPPEPFDLDAIVADDRGA